MIEFIKLKIFLSFQIRNGRLREGFYRVNFHTSVTGESHRMAERPLKPCTADSTECLLGEASGKKIAALPLSKDITPFWIQDEAANTETS